MMRYGVWLALARYEAFPIGTLLANILGSLLIGVCAGMFEGDQKGRPAALFLMVGFEAYYLGKRDTLEKISPMLYDKINELHHYQVY